MSNSVSDRVSSFISHNNPLKSTSVHNELDRAAAWNYGPVSILAAFAGSHLILQHRLPKLFYGVDDNVYPRQDLHGDRAERHVATGKLTRAQLNRLRRWEAAHYNSVDHLPVFVGAVLSLQLAGVPNRLTNRVCAVYLAARAAYAGLYITVESEGLSWLRTLAWWTSNLTCIYAFVESAKRINHNVGTGTVAL
ncbi:uncharacterized protein PFL1_04346 [Pseudozyma flocculosa PF-1]|uniref:Uncharacterized protein n=2 Tax=Pseudozyma flocculosa TaxID=84751 RepID=A0A5C3FB36_9BASI|nr:uncharacterized protein PFL1_04346 [Pseudozyma flocculosa PF-1]EPQ28019.1 hypothetical protein PFL1_04346 [Pseudozyma flocculosa PF-1]SPO41588.1 uncharacterized protein PSFLO_07070 [Pseudozyma flocculosa]